MLTASHPEENRMARIERVGNVFFCVRESEIESTAPITSTPTALTNCGPRCAAGWSASRLRSPKRLPRR
jgi:hypothetical protein